MDTQRLVVMANQIAEFFDGMPDHGEAVEGVAAHLRQFWEPAMRQQLLAHVRDRRRDAGSDDDSAARLHPLLAEALQQLQQR